MDHKYDPENPLNFAIGLFYAVLISLPLWGGIGWLIGLFFSK